MGLAGMSLGRELRALALSHTPLRCSVAPPENSVTNSRTDCVLTQQMISCIKAISPCVKSASAELFPDLHTMSAPSGDHAHHMSQFAPNVISRDLAPLERPPSEARLPPGLL